MNNKSAIKLGFLLAVLTAALLAMTGAVAAEDVWDGTVATQFAGGDGSQNNPYLITTGAELAYLAKTVNNGNDYYNKYIKLTNDINLNQKEWTPIGNQHKKFRGMFDGDNHYISNLKISRKTGSFLGLFGYLSNSASSIKNITLKNPSITGKDRSGLLIAEVSGGTIDNCHVEEGTLDCTSDYIGGLIGNAYDDSQFVKITNCTVKGVTVKGSEKVGGILGDSDKITSLEITKCSVSGTIKGLRNVGRIVGNICKSTYTISGCTSDAEAMETGLVAGGYERGYVGNIERTSNGTMESSDGNKYYYIIYTPGDLVEFSRMVNGGHNYQDKSIYQECDLKLGDIAEWVPIGTKSHPFKGKYDGGNHEISNLKMSPNNGDYKGLFGYVKDKSSSIQNVVLVNPTVNGKDCVGALIGEASGGYIDNCHVKGGTITGKGNKIGGLVGCAYNNEYIEYINACTVTDATINGTENVGGIIGLVKLIDTYSGESMNLIKCSTSGTITGKKHVGQLVGNIEESKYKINECTSSAIAIETQYQTECQKRGLIGFIKETQNWTEGSIDGKCGYIVSTLGDMLSLRDIMKEGYCRVGSVLLDNDLDLGCINNWVPIGGSKEYTGVGFDGNNHVISNLKIDAKDKDYQGLFGRDSSVSNLTLINPTVTGRNHVGAIIGGRGSISNCKVIGGTIKGTGSYVGGLAAEYSNSGGGVYNCTVQDTNVSGVNYVGGIMGYAIRGNPGLNVPTIEIKNCRFEGVDTKASVKGTGKYVGGIIGVVVNKEKNDCNISIKSCTVKGADISGKSEVGGIVGLHKFQEHYTGTIRSNIDSCTVENGIISAEEGNVGGIIGKIEHKADNVDDFISTLSNNFVSCDINSTKGYGTGGIAGYLTASTNIQSITINNSCVLGNITGHESVGGIAGDVKSITAIRNCYYSGNVTGTGKYTGGILGFGHFLDYTPPGSKRMESTITNCYATGTVKGKESVGGLIGFLKGKNTNSAHIKNCLALNQEIRSQNNIDYIAGKLEKIQDISNIYAYDGMQLIKGDEQDDGNETYYKFIPGSTVWNTFGIPGNIWEKSGFDAKTWVSNTGNEKFKLPVLTGHPNTKTDASYLTEIPTHTVTFDVQGHGTAPSPQKVVFGGKVIRPVDPTCLDLRFAGWFKESDCKNPWEFNVDTVSIDTTLYAKWVDLQAYKVTFNVQGHGTAPDIQYVEKGQKVWKPTNPKADHFTFDGWFKEAACKNAWNFDTDTVSSNTTLYAKWIEDPLFTVTFDTQGHGSAPETQHVYSGSTAKRPEDPTEPGYVFKDWYTSAEFKIGEEFNFDTPITRDTKLYAKWAPMCTVVFDTQGHGETPEPQILEQGSLVLYPGDLSEKGYEFLGWYKEPEGGDTWDFGKDIVTDQLTTIYAHWKSSLYHTVTFEVDGHGYPPQQQFVAHEDVITQPEDPTAEFFTFDGWYLDNGTFEKPWDFSTPVTDDVILYAKWNEETKYTVEFDSNGGSSVQSMFVYNGDRITKPENPTKDKCLFDGWYLDNETFEKKWNFLFDVVTENTKLYAKWIKEEEGYTITGKIGEGKGTVYVSRDTAREEDEIRVYFVPDSGYQYASYSTVPAGIKIETTPLEEYTIGEFQMPASNVEIIGNFKQGKYSVTCIQTEGGNLSADVEEAYPNDPVTFTVKPDEGYQIQDNKIQVTNVSTGKVENVPVTQTPEGYNATITMPESAITAKATFQKILHTITTSVSRGQGIIKSDTGVASPGDTVTIYLLPDTGYQLGNLLVNGKDVTKEVVEGEYLYYYSFTMGNEDVTAMVIFTVDIKHNIIIGEHIHGNLTASATEAEQGQTITVQVMPDTGYTVDKVYYVHGGTSTPIEVKPVSGHWEGSFSMPDSDVTISAEFKDATVVTFDAQGGTVSPASKTVSIGEKYGELPVPEKTGYAFRGWYLDTSWTSDKLVTENTEVKTAEDHTLYANWVGPIVVSNLNVNFGTIFNGAEVKEMDDYIYNYIDSDVATISIELPESRYFTYTTTEGQTIIPPLKDPSNPFCITITPKENLPVGDYTEKINLMYTEKGTSSLFDTITVSFTVLATPSQEELEKMAIPDLPRLYTMATEKEGNIVTYIGVEGDKYKYYDTTQAAVIGKNEHLNNSSVDDEVKQYVTSVTKETIESGEKTYEALKLNASGISDVYVKYPEKKVDGGTTYSADLCLKNVSANIPSLTGTYDESIASAVSYCGYKAISMVSTLNSGDTLKSMNKNIKEDGILLIIEIPKSSIEDITEIRPLHVSENKEVTEIDSSHWWYDDSDDDNYVFYINGSKFSSYVVSEKDDGPVPPTPTPSHSSGSSVTTFVGVKNGDTFTFPRSPIVTEATLPGATSAVITVGSGDGWYKFEMSAPGFTGNGSMNFQVEKDVLSVKGVSTSDVGLYHQESGGWTLKPTTLMSTDYQYAYYTGTFDSCSPFKIDFEEEASSTSEETKQSETTQKTEEKTTKTDTSSTTEKTSETQKTTDTTKKTEEKAKSPFPILGILAGLGAAALLLRRNH